DAPKPLSDFVVVPGGEGNRPRDLALMLGVANTVHIDFPHIENPAAEARVRTTFLGPKTDWTAPQVHDTGEVGKPVLLMTRDSFSNEMLPMLYAHFSRIILAHNQDGSWRPDLIERFKPDIVIQEVVEHGLRVSMGDGPEPSAQAMARIDRVLGRMPAASAGSVAAAMPTLAPPDAATAAVLASAAPTANCNLEIATLTPGQGGEATLTISGWLSELGHQVTSPKGLMALKGPGGVLTAPILLDKSRPDVATFFKNPAAEKSGFVGTYFIRKLTTGTYTPWAYRRAGSGWIACIGKQPLNMP
ncbi:MAG: hypothetical protein JSS35_00545, partial [Proteobacteria bacterium]|nr:hypothetical protein [Pseudomonadota bacterium]